MLLWKIEPSDAGDGTQIAIQAIPTTASASMTRWRWSPHWILLRSAFNPSNDPWLKTGVSRADHARRGGIGNKHARCACAVGAREPDVRGPASRDVPRQGIKNVVVIEPFGLIVHAAALVHNDFVPGLQIRARAIATRIFRSPSSAI